MGNSVIGIWLYNQGQKGFSNQVADHLSCLKEEAMLQLKYGLEMDDTFPNEQVLAAWQDLIP